MYKFTPTNEEGIPDPATWARLQAFQLLQAGQGRRNAKFFHNNFVHQNGDKILATRTWEDFIGDVRSGRYQPPAKKRIPGKIQRDTWEILQVIRPCLDADLLDELEARAENNVAFLSARNNSKVPVGILSQSRNTNRSASQRSRKNKQILSLLSAQLQKEDQEARIQELLYHPEVSRVALDTLAIPCNLGPQATVDLKVAGKFTKEQLGLISSTGIKLASGTEVMAEEAARQIPLTREKILVEVSKPRDGEIVEKVDVSPLRFFNSMVCIAESNAIGQGLRPQTGHHRQFEGCREEIFGQGWSNQSDQYTAAAHEL